MADRPKFDPQAEYAPTQFDPNGEIESAQKPVPAQPAYDPYHGALKSHWDATKYGMKELGSGIWDVAKGLVKPPSSLREAATDAAGMAVLGPLGPGMKSALGFGHDAAQVPAAIKDLASSSDPLGHIAMAAPHAAGEAVGQIAPMLAGEAVRAPIGRIMKTAGKVAADLPVAKTFAKIPEMYESTAPEMEGLTAAEKQMNLVKRKEAVEDFQNRGKTPVYRDATLNQKNIPEHAGENFEKETPTYRDATRNKGNIPEYAGDTYPDPTTKIERDATLTRTNIPEYAGEGEATPHPGSPFGRIMPPDVTVLPEPRNPFSGEQPNYMASVPREELNSLAVTGKPGAGTQLQQLGKPVIYVPNEAGFPGPRESVTMNAFGQPVKPVSGGSFGQIELPPSSPTSPMSRPVGGSGGLNPNATPPKPTAVPAPEYDPAVSAEDVGTKARKGAKEMSREETEKRARVRTPEELAHNDAWRQARQELGDDASSEDIERRVEEIKKKSNLIPNGSGESAASQEAINRVASEKTRGIQRYRVDSRSGQRIPLIGVDAVDATAGPYDHIVEVNPQGETVLDSGSHARPLKRK